MKVTIEIWQESFNGEWNCNVTTQDGDKTVTEYWAVNDFCDLLKLVSEKIPSSKCVAKDHPNEQSVF